MKAKLTIPVLVIVLLGGGSIDLHLDVEVTHQEIIPYGQVLQEIVQSDVQGYVEP